MATSRGGIARVGIGAVVALTMAVVAGLGAPSRLLASGPSMSAVTVGTAGCGDVVYMLAPDDPRYPHEINDKVAEPCDRWEKQMPDGALSWDFHDSRTAKGTTPTGIGISQTVSNTTSFRTDLDGSGAFSSATIAIDIRSEVKAGGTARTVQNFDIGFRTDAASLVVTGTGLGEHGAGEGPLGGGGFGSIRLAFICGAAPTIENGGILEFDVHHSITAEHMADTGEQRLLDGTVVTGGGPCSITGDVSAEALVPVAGSGDHAFVREKLDLTIVAKADPCVLAGTVRDGERSGDGHDNPMPGIPVELLQGGTPLGPVAVTDDAGHYCLHGVEPDDYELRATLRDGAHDPPLFQTVKAGLPDPMTTSLEVAASDLGRDDLDLAFSATAEEPWLADIANIHWQTSRFVDWVLDDLGVEPAVLGPFTVSTFESGSFFFPGQTQYSPWTALVEISEHDSAFADRRRPVDNGPENDEWHEVGHHVAARLGIAAFDTSPACAVRTNHGGRLNTSTCDSLAEGFATYLATVASLTIDAGRGGGYATPAYAGFGSLENNGYKPWSTAKSADGKVYQREDLAVAALLWDLVDDTPVEEESIPSEDARGTIAPLELADLVAIDGGDLVHLLSAARVETIAGMRDVLLASDLVPAELKAPDPALSQFPQGITRLDEVFLLHGFYPLEDSTPNRYTLGDPIGRTDHVAPFVCCGLAVRYDLEYVPGSAIRFGNAGSSPVTYAVDVTYPVTTDHFAVVVAPGSEELVHLELPPYWSGALAADAELPPCGGEGQQLVTVTITGPSGAVRTFDNCEYEHAILNATDGAALTIGDRLGGTDTPAPADDSLPLVLAAATAAGILLIAVAALTLVLRRRRLRSPE